MNSASISTRLEKAKTFTQDISISRLMFILFLGSLLLHFVVVVPFLNYSIALDDMFQYDMLARSIRAGNGFRWYTKADVEILRRSELAKQAARSIYAPESFGRNFDAALQAVLAGSEQALHPAAATRSRGGGS